MENKSFKSTLTKKQIICAVLDLMKKSVIITAIAACAIMVAGLIVVFLDSVLNSGAEEIWDATAYIFGIGVASLIAAFAYALFAVVFALINAQVVVTRDKHALTERVFVLEKDVFNITDASNIKAVYSWRTVTVCFHNSRFFIFKGEHNRLIIIPRSDLNDDIIAFVESRLQASLHADYYKSKEFLSPSVQADGRTVIAENVSPLPAIEPLNEVKELISKDKEEKTITIENHAEAVDATAENVIDEDKTAL